jgi:hypothetical protein
MGRDKTSSHPRLQRLREGTLLRLASRIYYWLVVLQRPSSTPG